MISKDIENDLFFFLVGVGLFDVGYGLGHSSAAFSKGIRIGEFIVWILVFWKFYVSWLGRNEFDIVSVLR